MQPKIIFEILKKSGIITLMILLSQNCGLSKIGYKNPDSDSINYFTALVVFDPKKGDTLINYHGGHYFTPASTVKLFTLYTSLQSLSDSIATLSLYETPNTLYFKSLADPSFLYDSIPNTTFELLKNTSKELVWVPDTFLDFAYGSGWQWDDYQYAYMPEKSLFPLYGNVVKLTENEIIPSYFSSKLTVVDSLKVYRDFYRNIFYKNRIRTDTRDRKIPFKTSLELSRQLLSDTLQKPIYIERGFAGGEFVPYLSTPAQALYQRLMNESDNFIAEQLFLIIAKEKTGTYSVKNAINYTLDSLLTDIPDPPCWADASGLSRYNLFTPRSMIYILHKMYKEYGEEQVLTFFPHNGIGGDLHKNYPSQTTYLYAKTGTLSKHYNLCGFLKTKKGRLLIFSYMNNHFLSSSEKIRISMHRVLREIYERY